MSHYHHPHHTPKKSLPSEFPPSNLQEKVILLAKVNLVVTLLPLLSYSILLLLFFFRIDLVQDYAKTNETFLGESLLQFTAREHGGQRWQTLLIQFAWLSGEVTLAYVLLYGAKRRDYGYMKAWLLLMTMSFLAEVSVQGMFLTSSFTFSDLPILLLATFLITDIYRFSCLFVVYLLIDEMLERGEVKRGRGSNYEIDE